VSAAPRSRRREPELFLNRELSWLAFNSRVLEEAVDPGNPLLERLKFATIVASNLDEFFMVRVAALMHRVAEGDLAPDLAGLAPQQQLAEIAARVHEMVERLYANLNGEILPALTAQGIEILPLSQADAPQRAALARYFRAGVLPALTPLAIDYSRPFPMLAGLSLNLAVLLEPAPSSTEEEPRLAVVQVPARLPRLVRVSADGGTRFALLEEVIRAELAALFPGQTLRTAAVFRIARDAEMELDDEGGRDYIEAVEEELRKRRSSQVVRLEVEAGVDAQLLALLKERLEVGAGEVYSVSGPLDVRALYPLVELPALAELRDPALKPVPPLESREAEGLFATLDERDILLLHPYETFDPVVSLVSQAAFDPHVLAIKMTLYRTSGDSPVVQALGQAAEQGKQVTVLVELMARFDEQSNIRWARSLEEAGAHVIYGVRGFKTHAKICLIVRRGPEGIRRYVHLGTGNYNERTARLYTDCGLLTSEPSFGEDASAFFNALTGYSDPPRMRKLVMAPTGLRERLLKLIARERQRAEAGQAAEIRAKMNSLADEDIIRALYDASRAGVRIRLNVRGICCLRPGVKGASERIEVVSIVDRFLEHARIFYFRNGGDEELYLSSADWMPRNLDRRIELLFPVEAPDCRRRLLATLEAMFLDNVKARWLQPDGSYRRRRPAKGDELVRAQLQIHRETTQAAERARAAASRALEPLTSPGAAAS
jgi:polyphosphate kinase